MAYRPNIDRHTQDFSAAYPGDKMTPNAVVLHTTEGGSWPGYNGGSEAPNLTVLVNNATKRLEIRQHFPLDMSSRALVNAPGGVETNTLNCIQIELVGSCAVKNGYGVCYWPEAPEWVLEELAQLLAWLHGQFPAIKLDGPKLWLPYPESYGNSRARMSNAEWVNFYGICGHQHVPENDHGDPGAVDFEKLLGLVKQYVAGDTPAAAQPSPVRVEKVAPKPGRTPNITAALNSHGKDRVAALVDVTKHGSAEARQAAQNWLDAIATDRKARAVLEKLEVK